MDEIEVQFPKPCDEEWEDMAPKGCNRHCAACDKVIYDLEKMTGEETKALLDSGDEVCVRAKVDLEGNVRLKHSSKHGMPSFRKVAVGAAASLGVAACATTNPGGVTGLSISGVVTQHENYGVLELQRRGETIERKPGPRPKGIQRELHPVHVASPNRNGEFTFEGMEPGTYTLSWSNCYGKAKLREIVLDEADLRLPNLTAPPEIDEQYCEIIVGVMIRPDKSSRRP